MPSWCCNPSIGPKTDAGTEPMSGKVSARTRAVDAPAAPTAGGRSVSAAGRRLWSALTPATTTRLAKLGITGAFDLVLHLPMRYDDETHVYPINTAPGTQAVLVEGKVVTCDVKYRPRRQLVCHIEDGSGLLALRFFNFYPSQFKQLAAGARLRAFGEIRHGFFGAEMVHPRYRVVRGEEPVSKALTPIYPTTAGLTQDTLRRLIERALDQ